MQEKVVWRGAMGGVQVLDGYPSTHILKPEVATWPSMIYDEEYGARFMRALGLAAFDTSVRTFDGVPALVVERFDRAANGSRVHVEDFAQVLGVTGNQKYQRYGGRGDARSRRRGAPPARSFLAGRACPDGRRRGGDGNLDLHAKNLGLLHPEDGSVTLAPAYDWVPMAHQPTDGELAMAVGGEYRHAPLTVEHLAQELGGWGCRARRPSWVDSSRRSMTSRRPRNRWTVPTQV